VGTGSFGVVAAADDLRLMVHASGGGGTGGVAVGGGAPRRVAIKKVPRAFKDGRDALRIYREIRLMRHFEHENLCSVCDIVPPPASAGFFDVYIVSPLMEADLHRIIYSRQALTDDHFRYM
jgi:mitogen-activated protein kinase 1/3